MGYLSAIIFIGASTAVAWYAIRIQRRQHLARANGCQPPNKYPHKDPFFGLDLFLHTGKLFKENQYLPELVRRYRDYGSTFETKSFGSFAINSIRPENLQTIWVSKFKDWGVQPVRLPAQDPFCGVGFITTDGPIWEHSRALLKPSFNRANMTDLPTLERYMRLVIDRIPKDGSTVDLQPLFFNLVSSRESSGVKKDHVLTSADSTSTPQLYSSSTSLSTHLLGKHLPKRSVSLRPLTMLCSVPDFGLH